MKKNNLYSPIFLTILLWVLSISASADIIPLLRNNFSSQSYQNSVSGTISICALRVEFQPDNFEATTGDGRFLTTPVELPCKDENFPAIDPAPHNNAYFRDHIKALSNFYRHASAGQLIIDTTNSAVFPIDDDQVYTLSREMRYYHPFLEKDSIDIRLTELLVEAVQIADADDDIDFSQYDVVVVFHAGVGQDFAIDLDPTPYDIPSAYLSRSDIQNYFASVGLAGNSILVDDNYPISEGIILPESQNHLLYSNWEDIFGGATTPCDYQIGLNGTFAFMMGFYLGLPGLYNTETGESGIGRFGLMDQGSANLNGLVPAFPSAWERYHMGWDKPVTAGGFHDVRLKHAESGADTTLWKIPVNDHEYFFLENRYSHIRPGVYLDSIQYKLYIKNGEKDWPPLIPLIADSIGAVFSKKTGVLLSVPRYDYGLPGSGLLIWHVDESVINANLSSNSINNDKNRRGVDLEEGDGAQDLGYASQMIGAKIDAGWYFDPWFAGNEGFWDLNQNYPMDAKKRVGFTNTTNPSSRSNDRAYTGICVDSIGPSAPVMSFRIQRDYMVAGFSVSPTIFNPGETPDLTLFPVNFDSGDETAELLAHWNQSDPYYYTFDESGMERHHDNLAPNYPESPTIIHTSGNDYFLVFNPSTSSDSLEMWQFTIAANAVLSQEARTSFPGKRLLSNRLVFGDRIIFCTADDQTEEYYLIAYDTGDHSVVIRSVSLPVNKLVSDGSVIYSITPEGELITVNPVDLAPGSNGVDFGTSINAIGLAYINGNALLDIVAVGSDRLCLLLDESGDAPGLLTYTGSFDPTLAFADIDSDGKVEIITKNESRIFAFNENLILEANFPISVPNLHRGQTFQPHILTTDVDGDGIADIIAMLAGVGILVYNYHGHLIDGFPRAIPSSLTEKSVLMENENGTFLLSSNLAGTKIVGVYLTTNPLSEDAWYCFGGDVQHSFFYPVIPTEESESADRLLDKAKIFNWPNPTKNNRTAIRYYPMSACKIEITIYDLAGNFIKSFSDAQPLVNDYNEKEWDVSNIANGVYFAVVQASAGGKTESKIVKIMVVH